MRLTAHQRLRIGPKLATATRTYSAVLWPAFLLTITWPELSFQMVVGLEEDADGDYVLLIDEEDQWASPCLERIMPEIVADAVGIYKHETGELDAPLVGPSF
jgi:hypothetical protein